VTLDAHCISHSIKVKNQRHEVTRSYNANESVMSIIGSEYIMLK